MPAPSTHATHAQGRRTKPSTEAVALVRAAGSSCGLACAQPCRKGGECRGELLCLDVGLGHDEARRWHPANNFLHLTQGLLPRRTTVRQEKGDAPQSCALLL